jgi:hypothetical protein
MAWPDNTTLIDDFNRASLGANWTTGSFDGCSSLSIISSTLLGGASAWPGGYYSAASYGPDCNWYVDISTLAQPTVLFIRCDGANTPDGYYFNGQLGSNNCNITRYDAGSGTQLGASFTITGTPTKFGVSAVGSSISAYAYVSGAWQTVLASRTDTTYTAAGYFALEMADNTGRLDNLSGGTISSGYTLTADHVHFTETGRAANLLFGHHLDSDHVHFTHTGYAANLLFGRHLDAAYATFTHTGQAANLLFKRILGADHAHYTLTGQDTGLLKMGMKVVADFGAFVLSGQAANLLYKRIMPADHVHFTLTGRDASTLFGRHLDAAYTTFTLVGQAATLTTTSLAAYVMTAARAVFSATGYAANLIYSNAKKAGDMTAILFMMHRHRH